MSTPGSAPLPPTGGDPALPATPHEGVGAVACQCYATTDSGGVIHPVLCKAHAKELADKLGPFAWVSVKYQRYFDTEQDAIDRGRIIDRRWPPQGYSTLWHIIPVSRWFLIRADWSDSCE